MPPANLHVGYTTRTAFHLRTHPYKTRLENRIWDAHCIFALFPTLRTALRSVMIQALEGGICAIAVKGNVGYMTPFRRDLASLTPGAECTLLFLGQSLATASVAGLACMGVSSNSALNGLEIVIPD